MTPFERGFRQQLTQKAATSIGCQLVGANPPTTTASWLEGNSRFFHTAVAIHLTDVIDTAVLSCVLLKRVFLSVVMPDVGMDVEKSLLKKYNVKATCAKNVDRLWDFTIRDGQTVLDLLRLLLHHLLTLSGIAVIIAFSLAPTTGIYPVYREAHVRAAEDARHVEKVRVESTYQILEWSYVCTALDVEGQTFTYNVTCQSFATENDTSLYKDVGCETTIRTKPTNAKGVLTLQLQDANCTKGDASERSECPNCPSPKGIVYRWDTAVLNVCLNVLCIYHTITAICKFSHYRRLLRHENGQSAHALRARILSSAWRVYFRIAFASIAVDLILLLLFADLTGCYFLPHWFCLASFLWIWPRNFVVTDETRFVCALPDSVFANGKIDEAEVKRLREEAKKKYAPLPKSCRMCGRG